MSQEVLDTSTQVAASVASCDLTTMQQFQYGGIAVTTLVLLILLIRSLTAFVKAVRT